MDFPRIFAFISAAIKMDKNSPAGTVMTTYFREFSKCLPHFFIRKQLDIVFQAYEGGHIKFVYIVKTEPDILEKRPNVKYQEAECNRGDKDICRNPVTFLPGGRLFLWAPSLLLHFSEPFSHLLYSIKDLLSYSASSASASSFRPAQASARDISPV